jgi:hypothetical protein
MAACGAQASEKGSLLGKKLFQKSFYAIADHRRLLQLSIILLKIPSMRKLIFLAANIVPGLDRKHSRRWPK